jgi:hypothetical protein
MSNQKIDLLMMAVMSDYVNGIKPYNFRELKGKVDLVSMMLESAHEIEENSSLTPDILNNQPAKSVESKIELSDAHLGGLYNLDEYLTELPHEAKVTDSIKENESSDEDTLKTETFKRWPQEFVDRLVTWSFDVIKTNRSISQDSIAKMFLAKFEDEIPENEKKSIGKNRPMYINKLHKNIYNNLIKKNGSVEFDNNMYWYVKVRYESAAN